MTERLFDCFDCKLTHTFDINTNYAPGNATYEEVRCPNCRRVIREVRQDWGSPKWISSEPWRNGKPMGEVAPGHPEED